MLVQVDLACWADGFWPDPNRHRVESHFSTILLYPGVEGWGQGEGRVRVDLPEVGVRGATG